MQNQTLDHQEIEWQFDASDLDPIESWLKTHPSASSLTIIPKTATELTDTYYDTEDWRVYRAGYALRVRRDDKKSVEATMKSLAPAEDGVRRRREISEPLRSGGPKTLMKARGPVGERLRALVGPGDLRPLFRVSTRRRTFAIRTDGSPADTSGGIHRSGTGTAVGDVALDSSKISSGDSETTYLRRVEVEVEGDAELHDGVVRFVDEMRDALELHSAGVSKFEAGLLSSGLSPAVMPELGSTEIDASLSAGEAAYAVLRRNLAAMLENEPGVRLGDDPEDLHDMRVATRRLRATLRLYADFLPKRAERFERDLRWVAGYLGEVRDLDVHLERLARETSEGGHEESFQEIVNALSERRGEARQRTLEMLNSRRYERLVSGFAGMLRRSPPSTGSILQVAPDLVRRRHEKVRKAAKYLNQDSPPVDFHDLRKKARRLRYALEPLQEIYDKPAKKMVDLLKELQDILGEYQDLVVAAQMLREEGISGDLPPQTVFAMGTLAARYAREAAEIRDAVPGSRPFRALGKGSRWMKLREAMIKRAAAKVGG